MSVAIADAEKLARQGLKRFPDQTDWPLLLSLVLTDAGRPKEALEILGRPEAQRAPPVERLLAEGYAWRKAGDPYKALSAYTDALKLVPANKEARTAAAALLQAQGGPYGAAALAGTTAAVCRGSGRGDGAMGHGHATFDPAQRFDGTDAAIARLDRLLAALPPPPAEAAARRRLRLDRLVALRDRVRMKEVVEEGERPALRRPTAAICRGSLCRCAALPAAAGRSERRLPPCSGGKPERRPGRDANNGALWFVLRRGRARGF